MLSNSEIWTGTAKVLISNSVSLIVITKGPVCLVITGADF